jgi:hypothetical protein
MVKAVNELTGRLDTISADPSGFAAACDRIQEMNGINRDLGALLAKWKRSIKGRDILGNDRDCIISRNSWAGTSKERLDQELKAFIEKDANRRLPTPLAGFQASNRQIRSMALQVVTIRMTEPALQSLSCVEFEKMEYLLKTQQAILSNRAADMGGC